ncbi:hypothetical protein RsTz2092_06490 [Deferribacterales bacterium RsTz2092]|nr:hypothetical protein AGMMS49941_03420 [Deferribacterales bacterium]
MPDKVVMSGLLDVLVCPNCRGILELTSYEKNASEDVLVCGKCRLVYPVRDGIPMLLMEEAVPYENHTKRG